MVPIELADGTTVGEAGASSDGQTSDDSDGGTLNDLGGALDLAVSPVEASATASADRALATVGAATAQLDALLDTLGLDLNTAGVTSLVTPDGASATQGLQVSGLSLDLGALGLDAEVLATLGLEDILDLLGALPGVLPSELSDLSAIFDHLDGRRPCGPPGRRGPRPGHPRPARPHPHGAPRGRDPRRVADDVDIPARRGRDRPVG